MLNQRLLYGSGIGTRGVATLGLHQYDRIVVSWAENPARWHCCIGPGNLKSWLPLSKTPPEVLLKLETRLSSDRSLCAEAFPERVFCSGVRPGGKSKLAPYLAYLRECWNIGEHMGSHVFREIKERRQAGSESLFRDM